RGHRGRGAHRQGLAAQIDVGPVLGGVLRGIAPIARAAAVAAAALTAAAVALLDRPCAAVVLTGVAAASGESGDEHLAGGHQRCPPSKATCVHHGNLLLSASGDRKYHV